MIPASQVASLLERSALLRNRTTPRPPKMGGLVHCSLVLQKIDGRAYTVFPESRILWTDREALAKDVADVLIAMSDPDSLLWGSLVEQVRVLAASTSVYFSNVESNPARAQFLAEWDLVRILAA